MSDRTFRIVLGGAPRPDARVTVRVAPNWDIDRPCWYDPASEAWWIELPVRPGEVELKFLCDGRWQQGGNLVLSHDQQVLGTRYYRQDEQLRFDQGRRAVPLVQNPEPARSWLQPDLAGDQPYDVIVVGSGMAGGVLAATLAGGGRARVLLLEAGSYLLSTHSGDGPRAHGNQDNGHNYWAQWGNFKVQRCVVEGTSGADAAEGIYLGGRSLFWGAVVPRMRAWELERWPAEVRQDLRHLYPRARRLLHASGRGPSGFERRVLRVLDLARPDMQHDAAPLAIEFTGVGAEVVPSGVFSTADLVIETVLRADQKQGRPALTVNLNHEATRLLVEGDRVVAVEALDRLAGVRRTFEARYVVMAAGTIGTPALALASGLGSPLVGAGITDHPIRLARFSVPRGGELFDPERSGKTLSWWPDSAPDVSPYNMIAEFGTDLDQNRFSSRPAELDRSTMPCELSFLLHSPLVEGNRLARDPDGTLRLRMAPDEELMQKHVADIDRVAREVATAAGGAEPDLTWGGLGAVSHEVGTMRMSELAADGVVDPDVRVHGMRNLYACDLSVFPVCPAANPSLSLAALALRLADRLTTLLGG